MRDKEAGTGRFRRGRRKQSIPDMEEDLEVRKEIVFVCVCVCAGRVRFTNRESLKRNRGYKKILRVETSLGEEAQWGWHVQEGRRN